MAGQFFSIIISTTVANPLNLLLSIGSISLEFVFELGFFDVGTPAALELPVDFALEFELVLLNFKSVGLFSPDAYSLTFAFAFTTKSQAC